MPQKRDARVAEGFAVPGVPRRLAAYVGLLLIVLAVKPLIANAQQAPVGLGTAASFAVLAGQGVTNTGPTVINGDLGTHPNGSVTGFPPGTVNGTIHAADAVALQAQNDLTTAYNDAAGRTPVTTIATELGGQTLLPGVYNSASGTFQITGTLTLDAQGDPDGVFIFKTASTLITASGSNVSLLGGAQACNVFWQVGSSATLGTGSTFRGNILALTSIQVQTNVTVDGRVLARNGSVTLDNDRITIATCSTTPPPTTPPPTTPPPTTPPPTTPPPTTPPPPDDGGGGGDGPGGGGDGPGGGGDGPGGGGGGGGDGSGGGGGGGGGGTPPGAVIPPGVPPFGGPETGGGATAGVEEAGLFVAGGALLAAAGGALALRRRGSQKLRRA